MLTKREAITAARRSRKFRHWAHPSVVFKMDKRPADGGTGYTEWKGVTAEQHFSPRQVATMWGLSVATIRRLFEKEPGVLKMPNATGYTGKRSYKTLRIPASIAVRVHRRISA